MGKLPDGAMLKRMGACFRGAEWQHKENLSAGCVSACSEKGVHALKWAKQ